MSTKAIADIGTLIKELGGLHASSRFFGEKPQTVGNWRLRGQLPTRLFFEHQALLVRHGITAPAALWGFASDDSGRGAAA